jgi:hypothetical protein
MTPDNAMPRYNSTWQGPARPRGACYDRGGPGQARYDRGAVSAGENRACADA